jgi:hypothetical protein
MKFMIAVSRNKNANVDDGEFNHNLSRYSQISKGICYCQFYICFETGSVGRAYS